VKLLLDTHVVLWASSEAERLKRDARAAIADPTNRVFVSVVTGWEIAIKQAIGKLTLPKPAQLLLPGELQALGYEALALEMDAALCVGHLPQHHRDPFDRLLIAHAMTTGCTVVTHDAIFANYGVSVLLA
jgi:PIN domain nuclease of toxin-antitoxin system